MEYYQIKLAIARLKAANKLPALYGRT